MTLQYLREIKSLLLRLLKQLNCIWVKVEYAKTEGIWLSKNGDIPTDVLDIKWSIGPVKSLGMYFGLDKTEIQKT